MFTRKLKIRQCRESCVCVCVCVLLNHCFVYLSFEGSWPPDTPASTSRERGLKLCITSGCVWCCGTKPKAPCILGEHPINPTQPQPHALCPSGRQSKKWSPEPLGFYTSVVLKVLFKMEGEKKKANKVCDSEYHTKLCLKILVPENHKLRGETYFTDCLICIYNFVLHFKCIVLITCQGYFSIFFYTKYTKKRVT